VVVITGDKTALFSPDDVYGFLCGDPGGSTVAPPSTSPSNDIGQRSDVGSVIGRIIGVATAVLVLAVVVFAFTYSPGPPSYTLTPTSISIHDRFYPVTVGKDGIDVDHIRFVNIGTDAELKPVERTNRFANSHYQSGWFRVGNGQDVRLYRMESKVLALLPPKGNANPVLFEVKDPDRFVQEVCQRLFRRCE
jgi:hypothetical protein